MEPSDTPKPAKLIVQGANGRTYRIFHGGMRRCNSEGKILLRVRMSKKQRRKAKQISVQNGAQTGGASSGSSQVSSRSL